MPQVPPLSPNSHPTSTAGPILHAGILKSLPRREARVALFAPDLVLNSAGEVLTLANSTTCAYHSCSPWRPRHPGEPAAWDPRVGSPDKTTASPPWPAGWSPLSNYRALVQGCRLKHTRNERGEAMWGGGRGCIQPASYGRRGIGVA